MTALLLRAASTRRCAAVVGLCLGLTLASGSWAPSEAQQRPAQVPATPFPTEARGTPPPLPISPGSAFWRALLVPGWGHAAIGSYVRGGVYFTAQSATLYAWGRTRGRLNEARKSLRFRETVLRREIDKQGITDPDEIQGRLEEDAGYSNLTLLVDSREEQQEDLIAFSLFLMLISSADAYVAAHLARFPDPLDIDATPSASGGIDLSLRVTIPN